MNARLIRNAILISGLLALLSVGGSVAWLQVRRGAKLAVTNANAKPRPTPDNDTLTRPTSEPYAGDLSIFEDSQRAAKLQIERVLDILKIGDGTNVADIGAGSGWFTVRAARRAGTDGKVYAVEINQEYLKYINDRAQKENLSNIQTVLGTADNPRLPAKKIDAVLFLKAYHEVAAPVTLLKNLRKSLRSTALVGVIDRTGKGDDHGVAEADVIAEFARAGFVLQDRYDFVKDDGMDYFMIFKLKV